MHFYPDVLMGTGDKALLDKFLQYFTVQLVVSPAQLQEVQSLRYRVYCEEFGYEPLENFPNKREVDEFDSSAIHCLIRHQASGRAAGTVRVVFAQHEPGAPLPFEKFCAESISHEKIAALSLERPQVCEVSRLAVDGVFRRRYGESCSRFGQVDPTTEFDTSEYSRAEILSFSLIAVAAFLAATAITDLNGTTSVFAMMEPFLPRLLKRSGIVFDKIGETIDYHGSRAPYFIKTQSALDSMAGELKVLYDGIYSQLETDFSRCLASRAPGAGDEDVGDTVNFR